VRDSEAREEEAARKREQGRVKKQKYRAETKPTMATNEDVNEAPPPPVETPFGGYPSTDTLEVIQEEPNIAPPTPGRRTALSADKLQWLAASAQRKSASAQKTQEGLLSVNERTNKGLTFVHENLMADEAQMTDVVIYGAPERQEQEM
jgi:hypothetical protein